MSDEPSTRPNLGQPIVPHRATRGGAVSAEMAAAMAAPLPSAQGRVPSVLLPTVAGFSDVADFGPRATPQPPAAAGAGVRDGRWLGGGLELVIELRVDLGGERLITADIGWRSPQGIDWLASLRTDPDAADPSGGPVAVRDRAHREARGRLELRLLGEDSLAGTLRLDTSVEGLAAGQTITFSAARAGAALRRVEVIWQCEEGLEPPATADVAGHQVDIAEIFADNRLELVAATAPEFLRTPRRADGHQQPWGTVELLSDDNLSIGLAQLEAQFEEATLGTGRRFADRPAFRIDVLCLRRSTRPGLLGVMFDLSDALPRQGAAVFMDEIADAAGPGHAARNILRTAVHEIGHALNLRHRFDTDVGRADSCSFMNYPQCFPRGEAAYWNEFAWKFDSDELTFLAHAPFPDVVPGGAPFGSVVYWQQGPGTSVPYVPQESGGRMRLELLPPGGDGIARGAVIDFGSPLFLGVRLSATKRGPTLPAWLLDVKSGFLKAHIRRKRFQAGDAEFSDFQPLQVRCFGGSATAAKQPEKPSNRLAAGLEDNLQITMGAGSFPLAEPGRYEIMLTLPVADQRDGVTRLLRSNILEIRVAYPRDRDEERDALTLFSTEAGMWFSLGGPRTLSRATDQLAELAERRAARSIKGDGVLAAIRRAQAIDAGRNYPSKGPNLEQAVKLFGMLDDAADTFDVVTRHHTNSLHKKQLERLSSTKPRTPARRQRDTS